MTLSGQLVNSQDLSTHTKDIPEQGHDFETGPFGEILVEPEDSLPCDDTDGSGTCDIYEQLRRRRGANHAHKAHKAQKKGDFHNFIDVKVLLVKTESTKQMEQTLRAKVKIFFKSENFKKCC